jgi:hypothetical protein
MERINNTIRGREHNYRGLNSDETPMLPLFVAYYNMIREHQAIGKTPANAAGINLELGNDKWIGMISKAYEYSKNTDGRLKSGKNKLITIFWAIITCPLILFTINFENNVILNFFS